MILNAAKNITRVAIVCVVALGGCATDYDKSNLANKANWLEPNVLEISVSGNTYTSDKTITEFAYLYVAELGLERGYRYFVVESIKNTNITKPTTEYVQPESDKTYSSDYEPIHSTSELRINTFNAPERKIVFRLFNDPPDHTVSHKIHSLNSVYSDLGAKHISDYSDNTDADK